MSFEGKSKHLVIVLFTIVIIGAGTYVVLFETEHTGSVNRSNRIIVNGLTISPPQGTCVDDYKISAVLSKKVDNDSRTKVKLNIDKKIFKTRMLSLKSGENKVLSFSISGLEPGRHTASIASAEENFTVEPMMGVWTGFQTYTLRGIKKRLPSLWGKYFQGWKKFIEGPANMISWQKLDEMGVNTIAFGPFIWIEDNEIVPVPENVRKEIIQNIRTAHEKGFSVILCNPVEYKRTRIVPEFNNVVLEWAEIAENYNVEMYAPGNHLSLASWNSLEELSNWAQQILPKIKDRYSGKVIWKGTSPSVIEKINLSGYDYVAFFNNYPRGKENLKSYEKRFEFLIDNMIKISEEENVQPIMGEFGIVPRRSTRELSRACEITFEKCKGLDGLFFMTQPLPFASENARIVPPKGVRPTIERWFKTEWINQIHK